MLVKEKVISQEVAEKILSWKHTGFSVHVQTRLEAATLTSHIPAKYKKMVVYYGWYSQPARGKRKRDGKLTRGNPIFFYQVEDDHRALRYRWSQLIKKVYADPLICPACGGRMRITAFIEQRSVIERILNPQAFRHIR